MISADTKGAAAGARLVWPRDSFLTGDPHRVFCPETIDLTGVNRILVYHPAAVLPAGHWRATVDFDICADGARQPYRLEFGSTHPLSVTDHRPVSSGRQSIQVACDLAARSRVELRLWVVRPTFHGELRFHGAVLERLDVISP